MLQPAPGRRSPNNSPHPRWLIVGMLILTVGTVAAAIGLLLQNAATTQADAFHPATPTTISNTNRTVVVGTIWVCMGTITTAAGVIILVLALRKRGR